VYVLDICESRERLSVSWIGIFVRKGDILVFTYSPLFV